MAKPTPAPVAKTNAAVAVKHVTLPRLEVIRHGNDDYTVSEHTLESFDGGANWKRTTMRIIKSHCAAIVARDYVADWHRAFVGSNFWGDTGL